MPDLHCRKKAGDEGAVADETKTKAPVTKRRQSKAKNESIQQEFKSKETIDTSDDDLDLLTNSKSSGQHSRSEPASAVHDAPPSADVSMQASSAFGQPEAISLTASVLPSLQESVRPSVTISVPPSALVSVPAPPSSPVSAPRKSKVVKKQRKQKEKLSSVAAVAASPAAAPAPPKKAKDLFDDESSLSSVPDDEPKEGKKGKQKQVMEIVLPAPPRAKETGRQSEEDKEGAVPIANASKAKTKRARKQAAILSSDEDEPQKQVPPRSSGGERRDKGDKNKNSVEPSEANKVYRYIILCYA